MKPKQNVTVWRVLLHTVVSAVVVYACLIFSLAWWLLRRGDDAGYIILAVVTLGAVIILEVLYKQVMYRRDERKHWWPPLLFYSTLGVAAVMIHVAYPHLMWSLNPNSNRSPVFPFTAVLIGLLPALRVFWLGLRQGWYRLR